MTFFQVPYLSLGAELSNDTSERTQLVSFRYVFSNIGILIILILGFQLFFSPTLEFPDGQMNPAAYSPFAFFIGVFMMVSILISVWGTRNEIAYLKSVPSPVKRSASIQEIFKCNFYKLNVALENHSFRWLVLSLIISYVMIGIMNNLSFFMMSFFWELTASEIGIVSSIIFLGIFSGVFLTARIHQVLEKKETVLYGLVIWVIFLILPTGLRLLGWFPNNGTDEVIWLLMYFRFFEGLFLVQIAVSFGSMLADIADEHALTTKKHEEGLFLVRVLLQVNVLMD
ncbi:MAG: MFS transporter [Methylococcales bacterium]|nr:MFS transporter [Methylococcales bacterium]